MIPCNSSRYSCGETIPSACVPFTGTKPSFITEDNFPCDVNIDDIIAQITIQIEALTAATNITALNKQCLTFDPATAKVKDVIQEQINILCALKAQLSTLQTNFDSLNIGNELITIDLGDLTPLNNPCAPNTNTYSLFYILSVLLAGGVGSGGSGSGGGGGSTWEGVEVVAGQPEAISAGVIVGSSSYTNAALANISASKILVIRGGLILPGINPLNGGEYYTKTLTGTSITFSTPIQDTEYIRINTL